MIAKRLLLVAVALSLIALGHNVSVKQKAGSEAEMSSTEEARLLKEYQSAVEDDMKADSEDDSGIQVASETSKQLSESDELDDVEDISDEKDSAQEGDSDKESDDSTESTEGSKEEEVQSPKKAVAAFLQKMPSMAGSKSATGNKQLPPSPLGDIESAVTDLIMGKMSKFDGGYSDNSPMAESVKQLVDLINDTMLPAVEDAHNASLQELERLVGQVHACNTNKENSEEEAYGQKLKYEKNSPLHKECRETEAVRYTAKKECLVEQDERKTVMDLRCQTFEEVAAKVFDEVANQVIVNHNGGDTPETYIRRVSATICGMDPNTTESNTAPGGIRRRRGGSGEAGGLMNTFDAAKDACAKATADHKEQVKKCQDEKKVYVDQRKKCNAFQDLMDGASCEQAVIMKDACETYGECYSSKAETYETARKAVVLEEEDRMKEWKGLKQMLCLLEAFDDGQVSTSEVDECRKVDHATDHLIVTPPLVPARQSCTVTKLYPTTPSYKKAEFSKLPSLAKGKMNAGCTGMMDISTEPATGSPATCKCTKISLNGPFTPGPLVKCENCLDVRRSLEQNSCPDSTKIFSPRNHRDWQTFIKSADPFVRAPHLIMDLTKNSNNDEGTAAHPMNSEHQKKWVTQDGSPWWLRSDELVMPNGNYHNNCYLNLWPSSADAEVTASNVTFEDGGCDYHSTSYYCQSKAYSMKPRKGSPASCKCSKVELTGRYTAGLLLKCEQCLDVHKARDKNSCPNGMKIFSPATAEDWKTFLDSAKPLRSPDWIIDITRPTDGCGGCDTEPMNSENPHQATWKTADESHWYLRKDTMIENKEPNADYTATCYMDLFHAPENEEDVKFRAKKCDYHSNSYYCQPANWAHHKVGEMGATGEAEAEA